ncbi:hypothetical protein [Salicibibacter kimchii]|uniref:Uncharacterized protein n=1 Tax=Salicibibacter kimchii TaxID=2099786 RepID=A0A345C285_9BACI|nr:hypothetical protein [Salicibibacter kimchii]AXF57316.1 hypothetical protein DT065_15780 [Salicibibacter kimchii]
MTKTKYTLILLGIFNLILFIVHLTDFSFLFLKPTGSIIPIVINMIVLAAIGFRTSRIRHVGFYRLIP